MTSTIAFVTSAFEEDAMADGVRTAGFGPCSPARTGAVPRLSDTTSSSDTCIFIAFPLGLYPVWRQPTTRERRADGGALADRSATKLAVRQRPRIPEGTGGAIERSATTSCRAALISHINAHQWFAGESSRRLSAPKVGFAAGVPGPDVPGVPFHPIDRVRCRRSEARRDWFRACG